VYVAMCVATCVAICVAMCAAVYVAVCVAVWSSVFQGGTLCIAVCCSVWQCVAVYCRDSVLQCFASCCSVLQRVAACCSVLQCVVLCCRVLQCFATCCSALQCVAGSQNPQNRAFWSRHQLLVEKCVAHNTVQHSATQCNTHRQSSVLVYASTACAKARRRKVGSLNYRSLLQNIVSFKGLFCKIDLYF